MSNRRNFLHQIAAVAAIFGSCANAFAIGWPKISVGKTLGEWGGKVSDHWKRSDVGKAAIKQQRFVNTKVDEAKRELKRLFNKAFAHFYLERARVIPVQIGEALHPPAYYINGIDTSRSKAIRSAQRLSEQLKREILLVHNPSTGLGAIEDWVECFWDRLWIYPVPQHNRTTRQLAWLLVNRKERFSIVAHSQGCIITQNALMTAAEFGEGKRMRETVRWVACAPPISSIADKHRPERLVHKFTHFTNQDDPIPQKLGAYPDGDAISGTIAPSEHDFDKRYMDRVENEDLWQSDNAVSSDLAVANQPVASSMRAAMQVLFTNATGSTIRLQIYFVKNDEVWRTEAEHNLLPETSFISDQWVEGSHGYFYVVTILESDLTRMYGSLNDPITTQYTADSFADDTWSLNELITLDGVHESIKKPRGMSVIDGRQCVWFGNVDGKKFGGALFRVQDDTQVEVYTTHNGPVTNLGDLAPGKLTLKQFGLLDEPERLVRFPETFSGQVEWRNLEGENWQSLVPIERYSEEGFSERAVRKTPRIGIDIGGQMNGIGYADSVEPNMPAARAGVQVGDRFIRVNGKNATRAKVKATIESSEDDGVCLPIIFEMERDSQTFEIILTPTCVY